MISISRFGIHASFLSLFVSFSASAATLSLDRYLTQVDGQSRDLRSAREASEGAGLRASEASLVYSPMLSADAQWVNDHKTNSLFPSAYRKFRNNSYTLGISQQTGIGLTGKLSYNLSSYHYVDSPSNGRLFWEGTPKIELSLSLLRNFFGSETRSQSELIEAAALAAQYQQSFHAKAIRANAESTYIQLANARQVKKISEDSLRRAEEILGWSNRRLRLNLGETSDVYQAQAMVESVKLDLQTVTDLERTTSREFNRLRGVDGDVVEESLALPEITSLSIPTRSQYRDDVRASIENTRVASANATIGRETNKPTLEVYGAYALNSREYERSRAISDSFSEDSMGPTSAIGVRFQTPLLVGSQSRARSGYEKERVAAETLKDQKIFDQEVEWKQLVLRLEEAKKRHEIAKRLVDIQKKKSETERGRLRRGRTTTYQTLLFEQDLNQAELARVRAQGEILQILAEMKTYQ